MQLNVGVKGFIGPAADEEFCKWSERHPNIDIKDIKAYYITQGAHDGHLSITITYTYESSIIPVEFGVKE